MMSSKSNIVDVEDELLRPYTHCKQLRRHAFYTKSIVDIYQHWLNIPDSKFKIINDVMDIFIYSGLVMDDVQDNTLHRGTMPNSHLVYGVPLSVNAMLHALGLCMEKIQSLGHPQAMNIFIKHFLDMMRGQGEHILFRENLICPTEEEFIKHADCKSSSQLLMPCRLMQLFSENQTDYSKLTDLLGIYYVLKDDYCNLIQQTEEDKESPYSQSLRESNFCEDLTDGKFTWPVIHALRSPEGRPLIYMLKQKSRDMSIKLYYRSLLERLGSIDYTRETIMKYDADLRKEIARLGGNPYLEKYLDGFKNGNDLFR